MWVSSRRAGLAFGVHVGNAPMLHSVAKAGFTRCGTVYHTDGAPRIAFQIPAELLR